MIGQTIAHYRITAKLGEGGMGAVYRATDTKLGRDVAVKVLPDSFAQDPDRMARFQREAQVLASLNHPNIAAIYGVEDRALIMELVDGPMLEDEIARGAIGLDDAIGIARQIAEALEAAHDKGIIHRDLKPANVKLTAGRKVKVLDFGLAKLAGVDEPPSSTVAATRRHSPTMAGVIMGTAGYMAPEQARGTAVDKRADIWAFGVVLFEMLAGRSAFDGDTVSDQLAAILKSDPEWSNLPRGTPNTIRKLLRRCLERDRNRRLRDIGDARYELENIEPDPYIITAQPAKSPARLWMGVAAIAALFAIGAIAMLVQRQPVALPSMRFTLSTPQNVEFGNTASGAPVLSPDGSAVVFHGSDTNLWIRRFAEAETRLIPGTKGASYPFWSPDSRSVAFFSERKLRRVSIQGGPALIICDAPEPRRGAWTTGVGGEDGTILFTPFNFATLHRVSAAGGEPVPLLPPDPDPLNSPRIQGFLPDRHRYYYANTAGVFVADLNQPAAKPTRIMDPVAQVSYSAPGYLLFVRDNVLLAQAFDARSLKRSGAAFVIAEKVTGNESRRTAEFSVSETGLLSWRETTDRQFEIGWFDRHGKLLEALDTNGRLTRPRLSPDGSQVLLQEQAGIHTGQIWLLHLKSKFLSRPFTSKSSPYSPEWSPDGSEIAFSMNMDGVYRHRVGVSTQPERFLDFGNNRGPLAWTSDGRFLIFHQLDPKTTYDLWIVQATASSQPVPLLKTEANERWARLSPDDHWLLYTSDESGQNALYGTAFARDGPPVLNGKWPIATVGENTNLRWRRDSREFYFDQRGPDGKVIVMASQVAPGGAFQASKPVLLFELPNSSTFDVSADGQRFLVAKPAVASAAPLNISLNWLAMATGRAAQ